MRKCEYRDCDKPARHSTRKNSGGYSYLCSEHFDWLVGKLREYREIGWEETEIRQWDKNNPGFL